MSTNPSNPAVTIFEPNAKVLFFNASMSLDLVSVLASMSSASITGLAKVSEDANQLPGKINYQIKLVKYKLLFRQSAK